MTSTGKVARLLTDREVALTRGAADGVSEGMIATVFREFDVVDPDTYDKLGVAKLRLVHLKVVDVQEHMCVGRTIDSMPKNPYAPLFSQYAAMFGDRVAVRVTEKSTDSLGAHWVRISTGDLVQYSDS
jgi:hypothetical protein